MLIQIENGLWVVDQPLRLLGVELGARMTVVALSGDNGLLVHSPVKITDEIFDELKKIGEVKHIVAPNLFHHLYAGNCKKHFPNAKMYCAPGLELKRRDLSFDEVIQENKKYIWSQDLQHHVVEGSPLCNEVVFFHPKFKTLIVTDLGLHICEDRPPFTRFCFKLMGMFKKFGWSRLENWIFVRDHQRFNLSLAKIETWNFEKIILSHGKVILQGGKRIFEQGFK